MAPTPEAIDRLQAALRLTDPLLAVYDAGPDTDFEPLIEAKANTCCFAFYPRWLRGQYVVYTRGQGGCGGAHSAFALRKYPDYMANFLTDGVGAPKGEGLKATPEIAQAFLDAAKPVPLSGDSVILGPLRLDRWAQVRSLTWLVDPDRLAALMTLAGYWSTDTRTVQAPFSSGCGMLWRELIQDGEDRPVLGGTDIAMRKYLPPNTLTFTVSPARFEQMLLAPDESFLFRGWWADLMAHRGL